MVNDNTTRPSGDIQIHKASLPEAKPLNDLSSLYSDLERTKGYLRLLLEESTDQELIPALFSAALMAYRRCFTSGLRAALSNADVTDSPHNAGWLHKELLGQADKLIAHSVNPFEESMSGFMVLGGKVVGVVKLNHLLVNFDPDQTRQWGRLIEEIQNKILGPRINAAQTALFAAAQKVPITEITKAPLLGKSTEGIRAHQKREP